MINKIGNNIQAVKLKELNSTNKSNLSDDRFIPDNFKKVAAGMESQFIDHMIKQMRKGVQSAEKRSAAHELFSSMQDSERSKVMANTRGGIGLKEIVLKEIYPKRFRNQIAFNNYMRQQEVTQNKIIKANAVEKRDKIVIHNQKENSYE